MSDMTINPVRQAPAHPPRDAHKRAAMAGLTPFIDALRVPPVLRPGRKEALRGIDIDQTTTWVRLHSELPPTKVWAYGGHYPGPTDRKSVV